MKRKPARNPAIVNSICREYSKRPGGGGVGVPLSEAIRQLAFETPNLLGRVPVKPLSKGPRRKK